MNVSGEFTASTLRDLVYKAGRDFFLAPHRGVHDLRETDSTHCKAVFEN